MASIKGNLVVGIEVDGAQHKSFEMRDPMIRDAINAIDKALAEEENTNSALTIRIYKAAEQLVSLGDLPKEKITGKLLMSLPEDDIEPLLEAQDELEKKRKGAKP